MTDCGFLKSPPLDSYGNGKCSWWFDHLVPPDCTLMSDSILVPADYTLVPPDYTLVPPDCILVPPDCALVPPTDSLVS